MELLYNGLGVPVQRGCSDVLQGWLKGAETEAAVQRAGVTDAAEDARRGVTRRAGAGRLARRGLARRGRREWAGGPGCTTSAGHTPG